MKLPADLHDQQDAQPTSNLPGPVGQPITPGISRPKPPPEKDTLVRTISRMLALKVMRFFGFTDYTAEVAERIVGVYIIADLTKQQEEELTRTGADYRTFIVDLNAVTGLRIPIAGTKDLVMSAVALVQLTAGATVNLHVGDRDPIPFGSTGLGVGSSVVMDPPEQIGLAVTNAVAQPAATATFLVSSGVRISP